MSIVIALTSFAFVATANAARISGGNAAELGAHRIEKLVLLKKIPAAYQAQFKGLEVRQIMPGGVNQPSFEIIGSQEADAGKSANKVSVILDENGKALSNTVAAGQTAKSPTVWAGKDPLTLTELAVHHIEHMMPSDKKLSPFYAGMKGLRISQMQHGSHTMAVVEFVSELTKEKLVMNLNTDGSLIDYAVTK